MLRRSKYVFCCRQGRSEVKWRPGQKANLALPRSNLNSIESIFPVLKEVFVTLLVLFGAPALIRRPHSDLAPGDLCPPCSHLITLLSVG